MKTVIAIGLLLFIAQAMCFAQAEQTIKGEVIDISCYTAAGATGAAHKACAVACMKAGEPAGILEEKTGKVYVAVTANHTNPAEQLIPYAAQTVEATGTVHEKAGLSTIEIKSIKETTPMKQEKETVMGGY
ncbi:MAG: hypothetical protein PHS37_04790 [Candidatus Omnitrophica bacterium]|nr:hypothetical protein [Candidatus Omnitrophota bacterium]